MTPQQIGQVHDFLMQPKPNVRIGVLGDLGLDRYVFGSVDRVSPEAPVLVLHSEKEELRLGCAANVVKNLSDLRGHQSPEISVFGICGVDESAKTLNAEIKKLSGIDSLNILQDSTRPTIVKTRFIAGSHHQLLRCDVEMSHKVDEQLCSALVNLIKSNSSKDVPKILIVEDYAKGLIQRSMLQDLILWAKANKVMIFVDPNKNTPAAVYEGACLITPNVLEAEVLLGRNLKKGSSDQVAEAAAREIQCKLKIKNVVLKRSAYGMTLLTESGDVFHFKARAKEVFDVTGAGDTVIAVVALMMSWGASIQVATYLSNLAAGLVVAKAGAASVTVSELLQELQKDIK